MKDKKVELKRLRAKRLRAKDPKRWTYQAIGDALGVSRQMARRYVVGDPQYNPESVRARRTRKALRRKLVKALNEVGEAELKQAVAETLNGETK